MRLSKEERDKKERKNKILLIVSIAMFAVVAVMFVMTVLHYWPYWFGLQKWELYSYVNVTSDRGGFDLNGTALTMGLVKQGGASRRSVNFTNSYDFPVVLKIGCDGTICSLFRYNETTLIDSMDKTSVQFEARSFSTTPLGYYDGFVKFKVVPAQ